MSIRNIKSQSKNCLAFYFLAILLPFQTIAFLPPSTYLNHQHHQRQQITVVEAQATNEFGVPIDVTKGHKAYLQQTPHSGRHFHPRHISDLSSPPTKFRLFRKKIRQRRFMEGWYYKLTLTEAKESFAFIFSIEDPHSKSLENASQSKYTLSCAQVMGPGDTYLVQSEASDTKFWAWKHSQGFGCTFDYKNEKIEEDTKIRQTQTAMSPQDFRTKVNSGFQMLPYSLQGKLVGHDGSKGGVLKGQGNPGNCTFDLEITPIHGWGANDTAQLSTAGWLAGYPVFEPHWQITLAHATASGTVTWKNKTYTFQNEPFYGEKNWGGSFPIKWYWLQCNAFSKHKSLAVTAGGGIRKLPFLFGKTEQLGLVGIHYENVFYETVPWTGTMEWEVHDWGHWRLTGRCTSKYLSKKLFEVELIALCPPDVPGMKLRAPTETDGMVYFCRDSFYGNVTLSLYELEYDKDSRSYVRAKDKEPIIDQAVSDQCAVEIGGGPWWDIWKGKSVMKQPMKGMVKFPYVMRRTKEKLLTFLR